jgi:D-alanyl-D-alanine dipeptidase
MRLVNLADFGIRGMNYYWVRRANFNVSEEELRSVGVTGNIVQVDVKLISKLKAANRLFRKHGYEIIVKDGYRIPELYKLIQKKRYENDGKEITDRTLNAISMPHATGLVVDINLVSLDTGKEVKLWDKADWPEGSFIGFYQYKKDAQSRRYQKLQDLLIKTMLKLGFKLGSKKEFWHFEYTA